MKVSNPILRGFNPDPCILSVEDDYYIATSTFEWFPGVQIHHSKDLVNWEVICRPLDTVNHLNMMGNPSSGGIWAPALSYDNNMFYLIFTDVKHFSYGPFKDTHNYLSIAKDIKGPWSQPIYLNSSGFDPSLFHDSDQKKYLLNMDWDYRHNVDRKRRFSGILIQEFDVKKQSLVGPIKKIFEGTALGITEGPHLLKKNGYYYLIMAEGGTSYRHAVSIARSKQIFGPYEVHPDNPILTSYQSEATLQKAGHGSFCQTKDGSWYMAHLCGRPLPNSKRCILGRETALQNIIWKADWPYLANGGKIPSTTFEVKGTIKQNEVKVNHYTFSDLAFLKDFQTLRIPFNEDMFSIKDRPGYLRLKGRESLSSTHHQTIIARRQVDFMVEVYTHFEFHPTHYKQMAGLIYRYDEKNQYYLYMTYDEVKQANCLGIIKIDKGEISNLVDHHFNFTQNEIYLKLIVEYDKGQFFYSLDGKEYKSYGHHFDTSILSDDYTNGFTGAFIGMAAQDLMNHTSYADFSYFKYIGKDMPNQ